MYSTEPKIIRIDISIRLHHVCYYFWLVNRGVGVFRTQSKIYHGAFLREYLTAFKQDLF